MRVRIYFIIILIFLSCSDKIDKNNPIGTWNYSKELFLKEQEILQSPKSDLSDIFEILMNEKEKLDEAFHESKIELNQLNKKRENNLY